MSDSAPRPLAEGRRIAAALVAEFAPACHRIEIAGSIRREKPEVSDIEIVAIPRTQEKEKPAAQVSLFEPSAVERINLLWERIEAASMSRSRIVPLKPGGADGEEDFNWPEKRIYGSRYFRLWLRRPEIKVDLFLADPDTWGAIFAIRTGSSDFSRRLVMRWTDISKGGHFTAGRVCDRDGAPLATPEEADVFRACEMAWVEPRDRRS